MTDVLERLGDWWKFLKGGLKPGGGLMFVRGIAPSPVLPRAGTPYGNWNLSCYCCC
jgi:hypothetical protein